MKRSKSTSPLEQWHQRLRPTAAKAVLREPIDRRPMGRGLEPPRTISEAAEELGLSVHTVRAWIACRRLAHLRLGRAIRIPAAEIRRVIEKSTVPAAEE